MSTPDQEELIQRVVEVIGVPAVEAQHLLGACANDVDAAVALYFEQGNGESPIEPTISVDDNEDVVRAPIAPMREQLIGPGDDNFLTESTPQPRLMPNQRVKVCPLRDFAREGALMEEQLHAAASLHNEPHISRPRKRIARAATMVATAQSASRLGDLYRPPTDIAYGGNFQTARQRATQLKHWLLVNVQSDNFKSQVLNRDVWSDKEMRKLIRRQFLLWQIDSDSIEGRRFVTFYHCSILPYICIIDPRTGEEVWKRPADKQANLVNELNNFLREHKDFSEEMLKEDGEAPCTSKRAATECITIEDKESTSLSETISSKPANKRAKLLELSEEDQIAFAIKNSMCDNGQQSANHVEVDDTGSDIESIEEFNDNDNENNGDTKSTTNSYELQLGSATDELTMLKLRLLNEKGADETIPLRWPSNTKLQVLHLFITQHHVHIANKGYKLICAFPRKTLEDAHNGRTLKEMGLHPSANLHVTMDD